MLLGIAVPSISSSVVGTIPLTIYFAQSSIDLCEGFRVEWLMHDK